MIGAPHGPQCPGDLFARTDPAFFNERS